MKKICFLLLSMFIIAGSLVLYGNSNENAANGNEATAQEKVLNPLAGTWKGLNTPLYIDFSEDMIFSYGTDPENFDFTDIPYRIEGSVLILTFGYGENLQTFTIDGDRLTLSFITEPERPDEVYIKVE